MLIEQQNGTLVASDYAKQLKDAGLDIITWSLERRYTNYAELEVLNVLKTELAVLGVFADWPATVTFFDNCIK
jgi:glycerophosphoryl diester phosphodiesterase